MFPVSAILGCELLFTRVLLLAGFACFTRVLRVLFTRAFTRAFSACSTALRAVFYACIEYSKEHD